MNLSTIISDMTVETIVATAGIIRRDGEFLITRRKENVPLPLQWEFLGGKIESGESPEECVVREIKEELGVEVSVKGVLDVGYYPYDHAKVILIFYECEITAGEPRALDCEDFKWISPGSFSEYSFPPADIDVIEKITGREINSSF